MINKLKNILKRYDELAVLMSQPDALNDKNKFAEMAKEHSNLTSIVEKSKIYIKKYNQLKDDEGILSGNDKELIDLVREEITYLKEELNELENELKILLIPRDPNDDKNTILEIRSGTGGDEAALFAADLFRMYSRFAERNRWKIDPMVLHENEGGGGGGYKEIIVNINGDGAYGTLKFESGVHRVQRVPETESSGRIHTSAATVAVLPEAEDVDIIINDNDIKIDTYRASGAGGQHVNKTESAIRVTHIPSGLVVTCQDESSQHKNRDKAMKVLRSRLYDLEIEKQHSSRANARKSMVSTGDRSAKIRTYNYPQGRVTDHRINLTLYKLTEIMDGDLLEVIDSLKLEEQKSHLCDI
tara:strand:+ start:203 stop:1273 length:1071 start_codon:yes stop_codon:yes gene_type:complete